MDFSSIGNINSYLKTLNMNNAWKQNMNNPSKSVISGSASKASNETYERAASPIDDRYISIIAKIKSGQKLSSEDMDYLREKYPADYDEVRKLDREKKEFEEELGRCKTKSDARMLHQGKITEAFAALKGSVVSSEVILAKLTKMTESYGRFTESKHYSELAENHSELAKAIEAEKAAITGKKEPAEAEQESSKNKVQPAEVLCEPQEQLGEVELVPNPVGNEDPRLQSAHSGKPESVDTVSPTQTPKVKTVAISTDAKPSNYDNRATVSSTRESPTAETITGFAHVRFDRQV